MDHAPNTLPNLERKVGLSSSEARNARIKSETNEQRIALQADQNRKVNRKEECLLDFDSFSQSFFRILIDVDLSVVKRNRHLFSNFKLLLRFYRHSRSNYVVIN